MRVASRSQFACNRCCGRRLARKNARVCVISNAVPQERPPDTRLACPSVATIDTSRRPRLRFIAGNHRGRITQSVRVRSLQGRSRRFESCCAHLHSSPKLGKTAFFRRFLRFAFPLANRWQRSQTPSAALCAAHFAALRPDLRSLAERARRSLADNATRRRLASCRSTGKRPESETGRPIPFRASPEGSATTSATASGRPCG